MLIYPAYPTLLTDRHPLFKRPLSGRKEFTDRYQALMAHYGMQPTTNTPGEAHENGDLSRRTTA